MQSIFLGILSIIFLGLTIFGYILPFRKRYMITILILY